MKSSADKFVLVALADNAGDDGRAFPSVDTICRKTDLNRKTVIAALDRLTASGMIVDTGQRVGKTKSVKIYRLTWANEAVPVSEPVPKSSEAVPVFPEAVPVLPREPSENRKKNHKGSELLFPLWKKRLQSIFNRRDSTVWSAKEMKAFDAACPIDEADLAAVEAYYRAERHKEKNICRRDLLTLLNNWPGETDRARAWKKRRDFRRNPGAALLPPKGPATPEDYTRAGPEARRQLEELRAKIYGPKNPNPNGDLTP